MNESFYRKTKIEAEIRDKFPEEIEKLHLYETPSGTLEIGLIKIYTRFRNQGIASEIMDMIVNYADDTNKIVHLTPTDEYGSDKKELTKFYSRFGFVKNTGRNKDFRIKDTMIRYPNKINENIKYVKLYEEFKTESLNENAKVKKLMDRLAALTQEMKSLALKWKSEKDEDEKVKIVAKLKVYTNEKKNLEKEIDQEIGLIDISAELIEESNSEFVVHCYNDSYQFWSSMDFKSMKIKSLDDAHEIGHEHCTKEGMWYTVIKNGKELTSERRSYKNGEFVNPLK